MPDEIEVFGIKCKKVDPYVSRYESRNNGIFLRIERLSYFKNDENSGYYTIYMNAGEAGRQLNFSSWAPTLNEAKEKFTESFKKSFGQIKSLSGKII